MFHHVHRFDHVGSWCLYDIVEYGLKQNDAAIFDAGSDAPYSQSVLDVFLTRLLATW